jgi:hypothetical protein
VSIDNNRGGNPILPLYYLCSERRLAPSMVYITLVIVIIMWTVLIAMLVGTAIPT